MSEQVLVVGAREPCPCGSGRRYKACHGKAAATRASQVVARPFEGLASECDWVALREIVPAATAELSLRDKSVTTKVVGATVLPLAWPAMTRADGSVFLGLQSPTFSPDASRDLAAALAAALVAPPGTPVTASDLADATAGSGLAGAEASGVRLQDLLGDQPLEVVVHDGFEFWGDDMPDPDGALAESLERASKAVVPTARLTSVEAAYWCRIGAKTHLRWIMPDAEQPLLDALARLHAARELRLGDGGEYVGAFRAHGLVAPVWDLAPDAEAADIEGPAAALRKRLDEALTVTTPLSPVERRSRSGLLSRQLTLR